MSVQQITWAYRQRIPKTADCSSACAKFVLVTLANSASSDDEAWLREREIADRTDLSVRAVRRALDRLIELELLTDTGRRKGRNARIRVWRLIRDGEEDRASPSTFEAGSLPRSDHAAETDGDRASAPDRPPLPPSPIGEPDEVAGSNRPGRPQAIETDPSSDPKDSATRPRDAVWDAFVEHLRIAPSTPKERAKWNAGAKEIRDALGYTPVQAERYTEIRLEVRRRINRFAASREYGHLKATPSALAGHWGEFGPAVEPVPDPTSPPSAPERGAWPMDDCPECGESHLDFGGYLERHPEKRWSNRGLAKVEAS